MNESLWLLPAAFGLAVSAGLNTTLPLAVIAILSRAGLIALAPPFTALGSDVAIAGLVVLVVVEWAADKAPGLDSVSHALIFPLTIAAGAVAFAVRSGAVTSVDPGLTIIAGLLAGGATAGVVHTVRTTLRPLANFAGIGLPLAFAEDLAALSLAGAAVFAPPLVPVILLIIIVGTAVLAFTLFKVGVRLIRWLHNVFGDWFGHWFGSGKEGTAWPTDPDAGGELSWLDEGEPSPSGATADARSADAPRAAPANELAPQPAPSASAGDDGWLDEEDDRPRTVPSAPAEIHSFGESHTDARVGRHEPAAAAPRH